METNSSIPKAKSFEDLLVWQKAHVLVLKIYEITQDFPKEELYGLISQIRRSAVSVPANIAEGFKKKGKDDKARFLNIAQGSLDETKYYIILAKDLNYIKSLELVEKINEISRMLRTYRQRILNSIS